MAKTPIIIDPNGHREPVPTIPGLPEEEVPREEERPTGPGIDSFFQGPSLGSTPVSVEDPGDDWEDEPPPPPAGIPDWAPISAMCLCGLVGMWALVDRLLL
jgi:hypothetical protein